MAEDDEDEPSGWGREGIKSLLQNDRGIFTKGDRQYLLGEKEYSTDQAKRSKHQDLRTRIQNSILDFNLLRRISEQDRRLIFQNFDRGMLLESVSLFISFVYSGLDGDTDFIEAAVERGIFNAERGVMDGYERETTGVEASIELKQEYDAKELYERYRGGEGSELTVEEVGILVREGYLDSEDLEQLKWERAK
jgi:hypothetical protein